MFAVARVAVRLRLNLNWIFSPAIAWQRQEPLIMSRTQAGRVE